MHAVSFRCMVGMVVSSAIPRIILHVLFIDCGLLPPRSGKACRVRGKSDDIGLCKTHQVKSLVRDMVSRVLATGLKVKLIRHRVFYLFTRIKQKKRNDH